MSDVDVVSVTLDHESESDGRTGSHVADATESVGTTGSSGFTNDSLNEAPIGVGLIPVAWFGEVIGSGVGGGHGQSEYGCRCTV